MKEGKTDHLYGPRNLWQDRYKCKKCAWGDAWVPRWIWLNQGSALSPYPPWWWTPQYHISKMYFLGVMLCATNVYSLVRQDSKNCAWGDAWVLSWNLNKQSVHFKPLSVMDTSIANIQDVFPWCMLYAASVYSLVRQDTKQMISYKFEISLQSQIG